MPMAMGLDFVLFSEEAGQGAFHNGMPEYQVEIRNALGNGITGIFFKAVQFLCYPLV